MLHNDDHEGIAGTSLLWSTQFVDFARCHRSAKEANKKRMKSFKIAVSFKTGSQMKSVKETGGDFGSSALRFF